MRLRGKVALVTGAARGIGRAIAVRFAQEGADLILLDVCRDLDEVPYPLGDPAQMGETARRCRTFDVSVLTAQADIRDRDRIQAVRDDALDRFGRIDALVNNAGIAAPSGRAVHDITEPEWAVMLDIDLSGAWRVLSAVAPVMLEQGGGSVINIASTAGLVGYRNFAAYVTAKHGIIGLSRAAALDYGPSHIRVNALCPGSVRDTREEEGRMLAEIARSLEVPVDEHEAVFLQSQPTNRLIEPVDVAEAAVWLAGNESRSVTGAVITVDGGFSAR